MSEPLKVLVVDDRPDAARSLAAVLKLEGCQAEPALSVSQAQLLRLRLRPDVIVVDLVMPGEDAGAYVRGLRDAGVSVVVLTGLPADKLPYLPADVEVLTKPTDPADIIAAVGRAARRGADLKAGGP